MSKNTKKNARRKQDNAIQRFFRETVGELRKVSWPTRRETQNLSIIVVIVLLGMSVFMGLLDYLLTKLVALIV
ncbi:MAG TPA: preprotein translocase subunit SecE [Chloroflexi bacterium]|nr:preprotein translocase subunit SecE [Chloroflexota bacterium]